MSWIASDDKRCTRCGMVKPRSDFSRQREPNGTYTVKAECKACQVVLRKKWEASLTPEEAERFHQTQLKHRRKRNQKLKRERHREMSDRVELAATIITKLRERGMTLTEIQDATGISRNCLSKYARGEVGYAPRRYVTEKLTDYYAEVLNREKDMRRAA